MDIETQTTSLLVSTHTHTLMSIKFLIQLHMHAFALWEETGEPGKNPHRQVENMQTPQSWPHNLLVER